MSSTENESLESLESSLQVWNFISEPNLHPMKVTIQMNKIKKSSDLIFVTPYVLYGNQIAGQTGALIMDLLGNPIWFAPLASIYIQNADLKVQKYKGNLVLTMFVGTISGTQSSTPNLPDGTPEPGAFIKYLIKTIM